MLLFSKVSMGISFIDNTARVFSSIIEGFLGLRRTAEPGLIEVRNVFHFVQFKLTN